MRPSWFRRPNVLTLADQTASIWMTSPPDRARPEIWRPFCGKVHGGPSNCGIGVASDGSSWR